MAMTLIADNTSDTTDIADASFTSGIDNTYKLYIFKFIAINPATDAAEWTFQCNATDSTSYDETMTTTYFHAYHYESDGGTPAVVYDGSYDQAQGTAYQYIGLNVGNGADECLSGTLWLFNPSSTTYIKHFYSRTVMTKDNDELLEIHVAGYINTATAIDDIQFKMSSGNFDGTVKMYGVG